jgi:hypothetical protein
VDAVADAADAVADEVDAVADAGDAVVFCVRDHFLRL